MLHFSLTAGLSLADGLRAKPPGITSIVAEEKVNDGAVPLADYTHITKHFGR